MDWEPTDEQKTGVISRTCEFIVDEAQELMDEIECPSSYISSILRAIADNFEAGPENKGYEDDPKLDFYA